MGRYFGTDGFRGEVNRVLTASHAFRIGRFLGSRARRVAIGKDTRRSSSMLECALAAGVAASGGDVALLGVIPTPGVAFVTRAGGYGCGVVISASHNAFEDNGIKLFDSNGSKPADDVVAELERYLDGEAELPYAVCDGIGVVTESREAAEYEAALRALLGADCKGKRIGLDCANGATYTIAPRLFRSLGAEVVAIHDRPDGMNVNRACGSTHIDALRQVVKAQGLDAGFAFDGDGDRCIAVDERGGVLDGDAILYILARYMHSRGTLTRDTVVTTVMSNLGLQHALARVGIRCEQTAVGDRYVAERMAQEGYALGGEQAGHIIFGDRPGDGILTALLLTERLCESGRLSTLTDGLVRYPQVLRNLHVRDRAATMADGAVAAAIEEARAALGDSGRILVRASGTEQVVRVMVEGEDRARCQALCDRVCAVIGERGLSV